MPTTPQRDFNAELNQLLGFLQRNGGSIYDVNAAGGANATASNVANWGTAVNGVTPTLVNTQATLDQANANSASTQRRNDWNDVYALINDAELVRQGHNPALYQSMDQADAIARQGIAASPYEQEFGQRSMQAPTTANLGRIDQVAGSRGAQAAQVGVAGPSRLSGALNQAAMGTSAGALQGGLYADAMRAMQQGGELTAQERYLAQQDARAAAHARGLGDDNAAIAAEVLNLDSARRARMNEARGLAYNAEGLQQQQIGNDRGFGLGVEAQNAGYRGDLLQAGMANQNSFMNAQQLGMNDALSRDSMNAQIQGQNAGLALNEAQFNAQQQQQAMANLYQSDLMQRSRGTESFNQLQQSIGNRINTFFDPQSVLGRAPDNVTTTTQAAGLGAGMVGGGTSFNDLLPYASDVNSSNYNGAIDTANSARNASAAKTGSVVGAVGTAAGAAAGLWALGLL